MSPAPNKAQKAAAEAVGEPDITAAQAAHDAAIDEALEAAEKEDDEA